MNIKVWFHPLFGVLNVQSYPTDNILEEQERSNHFAPRGKLRRGEPFGTSYEEYKYFVQNQLSRNGKYSLRSLLCIVTLLFAIYYFIQFTRTRRLEKEVKMTDPRVVNYGRIESPRILTSLVIKLKSLIEQTLTE